MKVDKAKSPLADAKVSATNEIAVQQEEEKPKPKSQEKINQPAPVPEKPEPEITKKNIPVTTNNNETENTIPAVNTKSSTNFSGGYFKSLYNQQAENKTVVSKNGSAGIFKSTSGWQDGKYYCFQNDATPGTVLKISNTATGKSIFAKVLDAIPDIKQNTGLSIIISNAAADELGAGENNFDCSISYAK